MFPPLDGAVEWVNSKPLSVEQLRGKVVLVDFWTYSCINCIRTIPYVRAWAEKYGTRGCGDRRACARIRLRKAHRQRQALSDGLRYPLSRCESTTISRSGAPSATATGRRTISSMQKGGSDTITSVRAIMRGRSASYRSCSRKRQGVTERQWFRAPDATGAEAAPDLAHLQSGEDYVGYMRASNFVSPEVSRPMRRAIIPPASLGSINGVSPATGRLVQSRRHSIGPGRNHLQVQRARSAPCPRPCEKRRQGALSGESRRCSTRPGSRLDINSDRQWNVGETRLYQLVRQSEKCGNGRSRYAFSIPASKPSFLHSDERRERASVPWRSGACEL